MRLRLCLWACLTAAALVAPGLVQAQTPSSTPSSPSSPATRAGGSGQPDQPRRERRSKWELEVHGGFSMDIDHAAGDASLPTTGSTVQGLLSLSTFTFGAGNRLYNQARPGSPIASLDAMLSTSVFTRTVGQSLGGRLYREINPRLGIEFSGDFLRGDAAFRSSALNALEATRASLAASLRQTLEASGQPASVTATTSLVDSTLATRVAVTGALVVNLSKSTRTTPYFVAGGGVIFTHDKPLAAQLDAEYRVGSPSFVAGYDRLWLRTTEQFRTVTAVVGGGLKQSLSRHTGVRVDGRVHLYPTSVETLLSISPVMTAGSAGPSLPVFNYPGGLQFSGISPLSGPPASGVTTFSGSGLQPQVSLTAGFFLRF